MGKRMLRFGVISVSRSIESLFVHATAVVVTYYNCNIMSSRSVPYYGTQYCNNERRNDSYSFAVRELIISFYGDSLRAKSPRCDQTILLFTRKKSSRENPLRTIRRRYNPRFGETINSDELSPLIIFSHGFYVLIPWIRMSE